MAAPTENPVSVTHTETNTEVEHYDANMSDYHPVGDVLKALGVVVLDDIDTLLIFNVSNAIAQKLRGMALARGNEYTITGVLFGDHLSNHELELCSAAGFIVTDFNEETMTYTVTFTV